MNETTDVTVTTEDDPTPLVLSLAATLRRALRESTHLLQIDGIKAVFALRNSSGGPNATLRVADDRVSLVHGISPDADHTLIWENGTEYELVATRNTLATAAIQLLLNPPLPDWRTAAEEFWTLSGQDPGMPQRLVVTATDADETLELGSGPRRVALAGSAAQLSATLSGRGDLFADLYSGLLTYQGDLPQLSAVCGAHRKAKFHA
ncbi:hypothetical protein [Mycolicibacterium sp.]|uniref:hypothetical protein n=1 Tax=Mycolicibacterium sp. TaxID=2320850 RepID=UPI0037C608A2